MVREVSYLPRAHSDHSPILLDITLGPKQGIHHWLMEVSCLQEEYVKFKCNDAIRHFWSEHQSTGMDLLQWEAFKATLRGVFIAEVSVYIKQLASSIQDREKEVSLAEAEYIRGLTEEGLRILRDRIWAYREALTDQMTKLRITQRRRIFEFGDKNSRLLVYLTKPDYVPVYIMSIFDQQRAEVCDSADILQAFTHFYKELYKSCAPPGEIYWQII